MRIWLLTSELPQEFAGGIARYVDNWARLLGASGHEVVVIARTEQPCDKPMAQGVRLIGIAPRYSQLSEPNPGGLPDTHPSYPYNVLAYAPALSYQMAEEVLKLLQHLPLPDIIESQEYSALPYFLLQRKLTERTLLEKIPILVHLHSPSFELAHLNHEPRYRFPEYWVGQMEKFCIVAADALLSPSTFLARRVEQTLQRTLDITKIPHPLVITSEVTPHRVQPGHIVCVGRLQVLKGVLPLVKACSRLWAKGENFRLTLVGGDLEFMPKGGTVGAFLQQRYRQWIESNHLHLAGRVEHSTVLGHMRQAWAVVIPSLLENFPNTCLEAMGVGQVVLASRNGGQIEMIETDGVNGFLFDWDHPGDFERQLRLVLALGEEERRQISQRAQARIRALCAPEVVLPKRLQHYESLIAYYESHRFFPTVNNTAVSRATDAPQPAERTLAVTSDQTGLLSVVIPYYNLGAYLPETLDSVLATTVSPFEIVIVNDGSTEEESLNVLQEVEKRHLPNLRIVHTENQGLASARNTGVEAARGEFVTFVDADDLVEAEYFARALSVLQRYPNVSLVYSWVRYFGESADIWPTWNAEFPYLLGHNMVPALAVLWRSAFLRWARNKPEFEYNFEDFEGWVGLLEAGKVGVSLPQLLVRYRVRSGSLYQTSNRDQQLYLYDLLTQRHAAAYREWGVELFNLQNANGPGRLWNHPAMETADTSLASIAALEEEKGKWAAEARRLSQAWAEHVRYIEQLEQIRDQLWVEVQRMGQCWEEQKAYIESQQAYIRQLEAERARILSHRLRRLARTVWRRAYPG